MPPVGTKLTFHAWRRPAIFEHVAEGVRLTGGLDLTLTDTTAGLSSQGRSEFELLSAADIASLDPGSIRHLAPAPLATDAEVAKYVHVDFWEKDLPWRYTPKKNDPTQLRPWMVLLVGAASEISLTGGLVTIQDSVLLAHSLPDSRLWAHTQFDGNVEFSRIVSPGPLLPEQEHVAVLVPAFNQTGNDNWTVNGPDVTRAFDGGNPPPALFSWRFWTTESGDFETLATALHIPKTGSAGMSTLHYTRLNKNLQIRGAITSLKKSPDQSETIDLVAADVDLLNNELDGDNILSLPHYGRPWVPDPDAQTAGWTHDLDDDPRYRGIAGLGTWMGVEGQESLIDAAVNQAGALRDASKIINHLATGIEAAGRLWNRRLSAKPAERLRTLAPMLARIVTDDTSNALHTITSGASPLDSAYFSSAAQRLLRDRSASTRHIAGANGGIDRAVCLDTANQPEPRPDHTEGGLPHSDPVAEKVGIEPPEKYFGFDEAWQQFVEEVIADVRAMIEGIADPQQLAVEIPTYLHDRFEEKGLRCGSDEEDSCQAVESMQQAAMGYKGDFVAYCRLLISSLIHRDDFLERLATEIRYCIIKPQCLENVSSSFDEFPAEDICRGIAGGMAPEPPPIHKPINPGGLVDAIDTLLDPRKPEAPARLRVCARLEGIDCSRLIPPEFAIGLDYPTWDLLRTYEKEWLLPGARSLEKDSITALQTNPAFIDAYMIGINTQFMSEMRWRDLAVDRYCTPLRMFWGQVDFALHTRSADIEPFAEWAKDLTQEIGALAHQTIKPAEPATDPDTPPGSRLVIAFRSNLFRRYPKTLVYLVRPANDGELDGLLQKTPELDRPDTETDIEGWRRDRKYFGPIFTGTITPEITFFIFDVVPSELDKYWLVLDEPPAELRFQRNPPPDLAHAAAWAVSKLDQPTRVAISGKALEDQATQP